MKNKDTQLLEEAYEKVLKEKSIDPRMMIDSVGYVSDPGRDRSKEIGITTEPYNFDALGTDGFSYWMETEGIDVVDFKEGAKEVLEFAKDNNASPEVLNDLKRSLLNLGNKYKNHTFFLYGVEADLNLGVI